MAHGSAGEDNPVALNVAPMVDIIFCLCIFFMCSFHFKQLEGKFESWMPTDEGNRLIQPPPPVLEEVRVLMIWDAATQSSRRQVGNIAVTSDAEFVSVVRAGLARHAGAGRNAPVIIDAKPDVPWKDVVRVLDVCKSNRIEKVELAEPMPR
ncbi:MAG: biopolymer transporter ExbD [Planctomycetia bacterium]|nr:biopolymer transporter ExbD [Planctomycetia bacterium]